MQTQPIAYNTSFKGDVYIIDKLSPKPQKCFDIVSDKIRELVKDKRYDLYVAQDYSGNKIRIAVSHFKPRRIEGILVHEEIPITAKASRYFHAAKKAINEHEQALLVKEQQEWNQRQKQSKIDDWKDTAVTVIFFPLYLISEILHSISPKWSENFEKLINRL